MNSKESQMPISLETIKTFTQFLNKNKDKVLKQSGSIQIIEELISSVDDLKAPYWDKRAEAASSELATMDEEERRMLLMSPKEKSFFLAFKAKNPDRKWEYFKEYIKEVKQDYSKIFKEKSHQ